MMSGTCELERDEIDGLVVKNLQHPRPILRGHYAEVMECQVLFDLLAGRGIAVDHQYASLPWCRVHRTGFDPDRFSVHVALPPLSEWMPALARPGARRKSIDDEP
jgi:hypothetical protein